MFRPKQSFAINLSDTSIEAMELLNEKNALEIRAYSRVFLESGIVEDGKIIHKEKLAVAIKQLLSEAKPRAITSKEVIVTLPESKVFAQTFSLSKTINAKQIPAALFSQARESIPLDAETIAADYVMTAQDDVSNKYLFVSTYRELIDEYSDFFKNIGLKVTSITMESIALGAAIVDPKSAETVLVLDVGARTTIASIFTHGELQETINVNIAGQSITDALAEKLRISKNDAEERKKKLGLQALGGDGAEMLIIQGQLQPLKDELLIFIKYFEEKAGTTINRILLGGGSSSLAGINDYFEANLGLPVTVAQPLPKFAAAQQGNFSPSFLVVLGLASIAFGEHPHTINFLSRSKKDWEVHQTKHNSRPIPKNDLEPIERGKTKKGRKAKVFIYVALLVLAAGTLAGVWWWKRYTPDTIQEVIPERVIPSAGTTINLLVSPFSDSTSANQSSFSFKFVIDPSEEFVAGENRIRGTIESVRKSELVPFDMATIEFVQRKAEAETGTKPATDSSDFKQWFDRFLVERYWEENYERISDDQAPEGGSVLPSYIDYTVDSINWNINPTSETDVQQASLSVTYRIAVITDAVLFDTMEASNIDSYMSLHPNETLVKRNYTFTEDETGLVTATAIYTFEHQ